MNITVWITGFLLLAAFVWMGFLSSKKKKLAAKKAERERVYRRAIERQREQERQERIFKADTGHVPTQLYLAKEAEVSNPREALYWYERAALLENEIAMYGVVRVCQRGKDDAVLKEKAKFWQLAINAMEGSKRSKFEMGQSFMRGRGIEQDINRGLTAIEELAEEDYIDAQVFMGDWYVAEANLTPNPTLAAEWQFRAAQQGSIEGQLKLGHHYREGVGVAKNHIRASYWYERAGEQGDAEAQFYAGDMWIGRGNRGNAIAYVWLYLSSHFGYTEANSKRDDVGNLLGVDAIVGLQGMVKPLVKKLDEGPLAKHSLIKALNKLYKRETYFPDVDGNEFMTIETRVEDKEEHGIEDVLVGAEPTGNSMQEKIDFSHSRIDQSHS